MTEITLTEDIEFSGSDDSLNSNPFLPQIAKKQRTLYDQKNYAKDEYARKIHLGQRDNYIQKPGTTRNVSPLSYNVQNRNQNNFKIGENGNIRDTAYHTQMENTMGPGLYNVLRNTDMYIPGSKVRTTTMISRNIERRSPLKETRSPSPQEYRLPPPDMFGDIHPADIKIKENGNMRLFDHIISTDHSVPIGTYNIQRQNIQSVEVNRNKRANKDYLKNFGFGTKEDVKYYNVASKLNSPCVSFKTTERFKKSNPRRDNVFLGPGSYSLVKKW